MSSAPLFSLIAGNAEHGLLELRTLWPSGAAQRFIHAHNTTTAVEESVARGLQGDVYVGATLRSTRSGRADSCMPAWCLWVDCDGIESVERLHDFHCPPTLIVRSGSSENLHAWWGLSAPMDVAWVPRALRRLAFALAGDMRATDVARIMRVPGTLNHKSVPPAMVQLVSSDGATYDARTLLGSLKDPPKPIPARRMSAAPRMSDDDPLRRVSTDEYYARLTGRDGELGRHVTCPFHGGGNERTPSMMLYEDHWYCWPCQAGGSVYDFGARLWGLGTRGEDFKRVRERLLMELL